VARDPVDHRGWALRIARPAGAQHTASRNQDMNDLIRELGASGVPIGDGMIFCTCQTMSI
jgi:hypothetical protein